MASGRFSAGGATLVSQVVTDLALTSNWVLGLDAGDVLSYAGGSAQQWSDISGGNNHFYRGFSSGAEAEDPTFNGDYFSLDAFDQFTETAGHTAFDSWHKNNGTFTLIFGYRPPGATDSILFRNANAGTNIGIRLRMSAGDMILDGFHGAGSIINLTAAANPTASVWNFMAVALNEATGASGGTFQVNGTQESFNSTYTTPSSSNPSLATTIGVASDADTHIAFVLGWSTRISNANLTALYNALKPRFGFP